MFISSAELFVDWSHRALSRRHSQPTMQISYELGHRQPRDDQCSGEHNDQRGPGRSTWSHSPSPPAAAQCGTSAPRRQEATPTMTPQGGGRERRRTRQKAARVPFPWACADALAVTSSRRNRTEQHERHGCGAAHRAAAAARPGARGQHLGASPPPRASTIAAKASIETILVTARAAVASSATRQDDAADDGGGARRGR